MNINFHCCNFPVCVVLILFSMGFIFLEGCYANTKTPAYCATGERWTISMVSLARTIPLPPAIQIYGNLSQKVAP
jgi:hypothetical protein